MSDEQRGPGDADRVRAARVLVETSGEYADERRHAYATDVVLADPAHALYLFRRARSHVHPLWTGEGPDPGDPYRTGGDAWERVQAAARVLELPETEPQP